MTHRHEIHAYDYVNGPYAVVRDALLAKPLTLFKQATTSASLRDDAAELHAKAGPLDIGAEIAIEIVAIENVDSPKPVTRLTLEWKAIRRPGLFPSMRATLSVYALTPTETQLDLEGTYDPPLGVVGDAVDAIAMRRIATESVTGFVKDVAVYLRGHLAA